MVIFLHDQSNSTIPLPSRGGDRLRGVIPESIAFLGSTNVGTTQELTDARTPHVARLELTTMNEQQLIEIHS